ncbi:MAG: hypothetical protein MK362_05850 [SAR202 cluster bacterium]|nr:hypothetical protein [Chloroflexota bacterium]MCH2311990.1 hypothetical protein [SAR202 cluster bacterium]|tara:strand:+ start:7668 stop:7931 length:264 start_codon:yes stop_codon:yes gene_type:complete
MDFSNVVAIIRDISIIVLCFILGIVAIVGFFKFTALVDSCRRIVGGVEQVMSTISGALNSTAASSGLLAGIAKATSFLFNGTENNKD